MKIDGYIKRTSKMSMNVFVLIDKEERRLGDISFMDIKLVNSLEKAFYGKDELQQLPITIEIPLDE